MPRLTDNAQFRAKQAVFQIRISNDNLLDWQEIFHNDHQVFLEIGSGKGEFISGYAMLHPEWNFVGFELKLKRVEIIMRKLDPAAHQNVRVADFKIDASIAKIIPAGSVAGIFIQHPDPWPKRKHFKRRLVQQDLLNALALIIKPGGFIQISTDHSEYANWIRREFQDRDDFIQVAMAEDCNAPETGEHIVTFYEHEQRRLGFEPQHMLYEKI